MSIAGDNRPKNDALVTALRSLAAQRGATPSQLAIAWVLGRGASLVPLVGARTRAQLRDSLGALDLRLSPEDLAQLESAVPAAAAGTRYDAHQRRILDSER
jgi:aryl-alcohol dehydrogenase-like predicted oxidoreductase